MNLYLKRFLKVIFIIFSLSSISYCGKTETDQSKDSFPWDGSNDSPPDGWGLENYE